MERDEFARSLEPLRESVRSVMEDVLGGDGELLEEIGLYNFQGGGKMLRPLVHLLSLESLGVPIASQHYEHAVIYELIHMASLLHDDIVDQSMTRRGRKAAHLVYGVPETVLAGDYLAGKAGSLAVKTRSLEFIGLLQEVMVELSIGELQELKARFRSGLTEREYYGIIRRKTAVLFTAAAAGAAVLSGADAKKAAALRGFSENYGMSFQIVDDILDFEADPQALGKPILQDQLEGRVTLPFILAAEALPEDGRARLLELGAKIEKDSSDLGEIRDLVRRGRGPASAREAAESYLKAALSLLGPLSGSGRLSLLARDTLDRSS